MEKIDCNISIDKDSYIIKISGLESDILINYSEDIDFTELINMLVKTIDIQKQIEVSVNEVLDEENKLKSVIDTLRSIFTKYNANISSDNETTKKDDDDEDFWDTTSSTSDTSKSIDDKEPLF